MEQFREVVNEHVAWRANKEDQCTGRFWEGRFKSQALLDEAAVLTCMSYVDLNPVRAGLATSLGGADFTSIQQRLREIAKQRGSSAKKPTRADERKAIALAPMRGERRGGVRPSLEFRIDDYIELLKWTGLAARAKPGGKLRNSEPTLLVELRIQRRCVALDYEHPGTRPALKRRRPREHARRGQATRQAMAPRH